MTMRASFGLVPYAFGVTVFGLLFLFSGCSREEQKVQSPMADPAFRAKLAEQRKTRGELAGSRNTIVSRMEAMVEAKRRELKTTDDAKVKAALEKDPEWQSLYKRCLDANKAIDENRLKTTAAVREKLREGAKRPVSRAKKQTL